MSVVTTKTTKTTAGKVQIFSSQKKKRFTFEFYAVQESTSQCNKDKKEKMTHTVAKRGFNRHQVENKR